MTKSPSDSSSKPCPFGPALERYWKRLSPQERLMRLDEESLYSLVLQAMAGQTAAITPGHRVIDAFCGTGGCAMGFARAGKQVTAIELNPHRLEMARYNAELFGVADRITFVEGDSLKLLANLSADVVFLAPPWGEPDYTNRTHFTLECFKPDGNEIMRVALQHSNSIVMQLPRNFDLSEFSKFPVEFSVTEDRVNTELLSYTAIIQRG